MLQSSMNSIIPMTERLERLLRTTNVESLEDMSLELEVCAINLWNSASLSIKSEPPEARRTLCSVKFFASLICSIHESMKTSLDIKFRSISCFLKTLKSTLDEDLIDLASKVQEHTDRQFKDLESISSEFDPKLFKSFNKIKTELFTTKMVLSLIENDVEMAKFYEERADLKNQSIEDPALALECSRIIFNSSLSLYEKKQFTDAAYFLEKAIGYLEGQTLEVDLVKSSICSLLAYSCIELATVEYFRLAAFAVENLQSCAPSSLDSFKLDIKIKRLQQSNNSDIEDIIMRMLISVPVIKNFNEVLAIINEHSNDDPLGAIKCYDFAFTNQLSPMEDHDSLEMLFIATINAFVKDKTTPKNIKLINIKKFFDKSERIFAKPISKKMSSCSVILLWTTGKAETKNKNYEDSIGWFELCLHRVIGIVEIDKAKVQRALQNSFIELNNFDKVVEIYDEMDDSEKKAVITQYNMFKVYSFKEDQPKLLSCLKSISETSDSNTVPLLALCAVNTTTNSLVAIESMLILFRKLSDGLDSTVSIPSTLRCVISLILKQETDPEFYKSHYIDTLLVLLKEAFKFSSGSVNIDNYKFSNDELKWFCSHCFNIGRNCLLSNNYLPAQFFAEESINFNGLISDDVSINESLWLKLWKFRARLIILMSLSMTPDIDHDILWKSIREQSLKLRLEIDELMLIYRDKKEYSSYEGEWKTCLLDAIIYQFQAELELNNWSSTDSILNETIKLKNIDFDSTMVNIVVEDKFPNRIKSSIISKIIQRNIGNAKIDGVILSRWVRLLLKASVDIFETEDNGLKVLEQIISRLKSEDESNRLPAHEIEWISSTCWNLGVGKLFSDDKAGGKNWCKVAMRLANFVNERFELTLKNLWDELSTTTDT